MSLTERTTASSREHYMSAAKQPAFHAFLFGVLLVGIGSILGFLSFYLVFRDRCAKVVLDCDLGHNASKVEIETKYSRAIEDVRQCQEDCQVKGNLQELQGRLQAQAALSDKHQDLLTRHERTLEKIGELSEMNQGSQSQIHALKEEIRSIQASLYDSAEKLRDAQLEREVTQQELVRQMAHAGKMREDWENESSELRDLYDSCSQHVENAEGKLSELINLVQQQNYASTIAMYGEGPYVVRFNVEFPYEPRSPNYFEIRIFNARDMPHMVLTFLNMVDNGLYVDTAIDFVKDKVIKGGSLASVEPQLGKNMKSTVLRRFANFGYSAHNTLFFENESSPNSPCRHSSFGLHERGPGFKIYLTNDLENAPNNCPGVIMKGRDTLERLLQAHTNTPDGGELTWKVPIVATYLVSLEDEL